LAREDASCMLNVVLLDVRTLQPLSRISATGFASALGGCLTASPRGDLYFWEAGQTLTKRSSLPSGPVDGPVWLAEVRSRFVAAVAPWHPQAPVWFYDQRCPEPVAARVANLSSLGLGLPGNVADKEVRPEKLTWTVEHIHVHGALLILLAHVTDWSLDSEAAPPDVVAGHRLFAWHLPSCRPLLAGHEAPSITTFARTDGCGGRLAFAGARSSDAKAAHFVVIPGVGSVRKPARHIGVAPARTVPARASASDLRPRPKGLHKLGRLRRS